MFLLFNKRNSRQEHGINSNLSVNVLRSSKEKHPKTKMKQFLATAILHTEKHWKKEQNLMASNEFTVKICTDYCKISQRENMHIESEGSHLMGHSGFTTIGYSDHKYSIQEYHFGYNINLFIHEIVSIS